MTIVLQLLHAIKSAGGISRKQKFYLQPIVCECGNRLVVKKDRGNPYYGN